MTNDRGKSRVSEIEEKIADLKGRWPKHSLRPEMMQQLEVLEEELERASREEREETVSEIKYGYRRQVYLTYEAAVAKVKEELKKEGFGVMTEIDVRDTIKKKLNLEFDKYIILGACNPPFAHQALMEERDIGLLMPCNLVVYEHDGKTFVASTLPTVTMGMVQNAKLAGVARQVEAKLRAVVDRV